MGKDWSTAASYLEDLYADLLACAHQEDLPSYD